MLTSAELADLLRLNEKSVIKMITVGKLPVMKIACQLSFSTRKIMEWIEAKMPDFPDDLLDDLSKGISGTRIQIHQLLKPELIAIDMKAKNKEEAIKEIAGLAKNTWHVRDKEELLKMVNEREERCSTAIGNEMAFPHPSFVSWKTIRNPLIAIGISKNGVEFNSPDGKPVKVFFLLAIPGTGNQLQVMSHIIRMLRDKKARDDVIKALTPEEIIGILKNSETLINQPF